MSSASIVKKTAAVAAALCLLCAGGSVIGSASSGVVELPVIPLTDENDVFEKNGFKYILEGTSASIVGCTLEDDDMLIIPAQINGWEVTSVEKGFLGEGASFGTVVFPSTLKKIANRAINKADVGKVVFPAGLTNIPEEAVCSKKMHKAYEEYLAGLGLGGNTGELDLMGQTGLVKPVGNALTVVCAKGSAAESYANAIGAEKQIMTGYTGLAGDINCDGVRNNRDIKQLQKYITGSDASIFTPSFDVNGDGVINNPDMKHLQKYLIGENVKVY